MVAYYFIEFYLKRISVLYYYILILCQENGYQLLFLSARAIVQAYLTRNFLLNLKQVLKQLGFLQSMTTYFYIVGLFCF